MAVPGTYNPYDDFNIIAECNVPDNVKKPTCKAKDTSIMIDEKSAQEYCDEGFYTSIEGSCKREHCVYNSNNYNYYCPDNVNKLAIGRDKNEDGTFTPKSSSDINPCVDNYHIVYSDTNNPNDISDTCEINTCYTPASNVYTNYDKVDDILLNADEIKEKRVQCSQGNSLLEGLCLPIDYDVCINIIDEDTCNGKNNESDRNVCLWSVYEGEGKCESKNEEMNYCIDKITGVQSGEPEEICNRDDKCQYNDRFTDGARLTPCEEHYGDVVDVIPTQAQRWGYEGCQTTCRDWYNPSDGIIPSNIEIEGDQGICRNFNNYVIDNDRKIPSFDILSNLNNTVEQYCCSDITCGSYDCESYNELRNYKQKEGTDLMFIFNDSWIINPLQICCEPKTCNDWAEEGNMCNFSNQKNDTLISGKIGFSSEECCFTTCETWNNTLLNTKLSEIFPETIVQQILTENEEINHENIREIILNKLTINPNANISSEDLEILNNPEEDIPTSISHIIPCSKDYKLFGDKQGDDENTCCISKNNTCLTKTWDCPENMFRNIDNLYQYCENNNRDEGCIMTSQNIEICCKDFEKCKDMDCPEGYIVDSYKKEEYCENAECSKTDDLDTCCVEKEKCKDLRCGNNFSNDPNNSENYCVNEKCNIPNDRANCCIGNEVCEDMECPIGFYNNEKNKNRKCYEKVCNPENKLDMLKCCKECKSVENASEYICTNDSDSIATTCFGSYTLVNGKCEGDKEIYDVSFKLDGDYDTFMEDSNNSILLKQELCDLLSLSPSQCNELEIIGFEKGSVIVNFRLKSEKNTDEKISEADIKTKLEKGNKFFNMNVIDNPNVRQNVKEGEQLLRCNTHTCPYGTRLKENPSSVYGNSNRECCGIDWKIMKIVIPIFLVVLLCIYILFSIIFSSIITKGE